MIRIRMLVCSSLGFVQPVPVSEDKAAQAVQAEQDVINLLLSIVLMKCPAMVVFLSIFPPKIKIYHAWEKKEKKFLTAVKPGD